MLLVIFLLVNLLDSTSQEFDPGLRENWLRHFLDTRQNGAVEGTQRKQTTPLFQIGYTLPMFRIN